MPDDGRSPLVVVLDDAAEEQEEQFGPAMAALDAKERCFVVAMFAPRANPSKAALAAGFGAQCASAARVAGHRLMRKPRIALAMVELAHTTLRTSTPKAVKILTDLAFLSPSEETRRRAAINVLSLAGMSPIVRQEHKVDIVAHTVEHKSDDAATLLRIKGKLEALGLDPALYLGNRLRALVEPAPSISDAEIEEVASLPAAL